ncbi:hypothetical protein [Acidianus ambivalens]|uniref:Uncharacterized protein n=1 Tax=Acidianus ambivalens TaxID=2283 RepID=A0A650CU05_ACIAM|nr:hypothetical protein [Acidianus ambivalens]MQL56148.1 hypothetical protein [Acidianus ambivalens]QGR21309.1 hypothetical protein D1866_04345 [Acidianus ambivalens]
MPIGVGETSICKINITEILYYTHGQWCIAKLSIVPISYSPHSITFCLNTISDLAIVTSYGNL